MIFDEWLVRRFPDMRPNSDNPLLVPIIDLMRSTWKSRGEEDAKIADGLSVSYPDDDWDAGRKSACEEIAERIREAA